MKTALVDGLARPDPALLLADAEARVAYSAKNPPPIVDLRGVEPVPSMAINIPCPAGETWYVFAFEQVLSERRFNNLTVDRPTRLEWFVTGNGAFWNPVPLTPANHKRPSLTGQFCSDCPDNSAAHRDCIWNGCSKDRAALADAEARGRGENLDGTPRRETRPAPGVRGLPRIDPEFIVIFASAWCNDRGVGIGYDWDGQRFNNRNDAIRHGLKTRGSDDFNIGQTYGDDLIWFGWMDERHREDEDAMREIAEAIGLSFDPRWHALEYSRATGEVTTPAVHSALADAQAQRAPEGVEVTDDMVLAAARAMAELEDVHVNTLHTVHARHALKAALSPEPADVSPRREMGEEPAPWDERWDDHLAGTGLERTAPPPDPAAAPGDARVTEDELMALISAAYRRGAAWWQENADAEYLNKASLDYADATLSTRGEAH